MREVTGVGETCWHWKVRSIYMDNRFDNLAWRPQTNYRFKLASVNINKSVPAVFVSGTLKPPLTNRGVGHGEIAEIYQCDVCKDSYSVTEMAFTQKGAELCSDCWNVIPF
jgi:hypothetical protein